MNATSPSSPPHRNPPIPALPSQKDPTWWRGGWIPYIVLLLVAAAADFLCPLFTDECHTGFGTALGTLLFMAALLLLRRDFTRWETLFLVVFALLSSAGQAVSGSVPCWLGLFIVPIVLLILPKQSREPQEKGRNWWMFWIAQRPEGSKLGRTRNLLPILVSGAVGIALFFAFLAIFASGNPVVKMAWDFITEWWNKMLVFLHIDMSFWGHLLVWALGLFGFGFYTFARTHELPKPPVPAQGAATGSSMLPQLPSFALTGINAAFLIATASDMIFLWCRRIPEGISQTEYLHEGADSITWAAVLAAGILLLLFRREGIARNSTLAKGLGYLLVLQTALLSVSVVLRLAFQIEDFGFTYRRVLAAECLMCGMVGIVLLLCYMAGNGRFMQHLRTGFCVIVLFFFGFNIQPPSALAADLNMAFADSHPHWKFGYADFSNGRFDARNCLSFAAAHIPPGTENGVARNMMEAAKSIVRCNEDSWRARSINTLRFAELAREIETTPINETSAKEND